MELHIWLVLIKALDEYEPHYKEEVKEVISKFEDLFQKPKELPHKIDIQHEI